MAWRQTTAKNYAFQPTSPSALQHYDRLFQTPVDLHYELGQQTPSLAITCFGQLDRSTAYNSLPVSKAVKMGTREVGTRLLKRVPILKLLEFQVVLICIFGKKWKK